MNTKLRTRLLTLVLILLIVTPLVTIGCREEVTPSSTPTPNVLTETLVPNVPLDVYLYAKQGSPTTIPADLFDLTRDINVESLAVWGVAAEENFTLGTAITLASESETSALYNQIALEDYSWKKLSGNTVYLVQGSGVAAESLKTAISKNDFRYYDDSESLEAVRLLPNEDKTKLVAIGVAKPSGELIEMITNLVGIKGLDLADFVLKLANIKVIAAGLYSPHRIDVAEIAEVMRSDGGINDLDLGSLVIVRSGLPSFLVESTVEQIAARYEFWESKLGDLSLYKRSWDTNRGETVHVLIRVEGNNIFISVSSQESYAEALITSVQVQE